MVTAAAKKRGPGAAINAGSTKSPPTPPPRVYQVIPTNSSSDNLPPCSMDNSINEWDLKQAHHQGRLDRFTVMETPEGEFFVVAHVHGKTWYVVTRRVRTVPRIWVNLHRLNSNLREQFPLIHWELKRNRKIPPQGTH